MTTRMAFGLHAHQPVGNFPRVLRRITREAYRPFLEAFRRRVDARISYHFSGPLLDWWCEEEPEMVDLIGKLVEEDRLELMAGGHFEPILPLIPRRDRRRQVTRHLDRLESLFGRRPRGFWLTERVWYPELPETLREVGIEYTAVDEFHFHAAGWDTKRLSGYYTTESSGEPVHIFPISKELRYRIPFHEVNEIEDFLQASEADYLTFADDSEKFGSWPGTKNWVYEEGWLKRFFRRCSEGTINLCALGDVYENQESNGSCYLPTASYPEMLEWSLPADQQRLYEDWKKRAPEDVRQFGRGGHFHHFLLKYEESNRLHKRMLWLSRRIDPDRHPTAYEHLLKAQCNDTYWHGVFGGLFLPHLRFSIWQQLGRAHRQRDIEIETPERTDYDLDGRDEIVYTDTSQFIVLDPSRGSEALTWEIYPPGRNLLDTLTRRWEAYLTEQEPEDREDMDDAEKFHHSRTAVPPEWKQKWAEDPCPRAGFQPVSVQETGPEPLRVHRGITYLLRNTSPTRVETGRGHVTLAYPDPPEEIRWRFEPETLTWRADRTTPATDWWGIQSSLGFRSTDPEQCLIRVADDEAAVDRERSLETNRFELIDRLADVRLSVSSPETVRVATYPIETISRSEEKAERIYQGTAITVLTRKDSLELRWSWESDPSGLD